MRRLERPKLSDHAMRVLEKRTDKVKAAPDARAEAGRLWNNKPNKAFDEIRKKLAVMASGASRCMYCEDSAGTDMEHFRSQYTGVSETIDTRPNCYRVPAFPHH